MWIRNTSSYDTAEVKRLIGFATRGVNMTRVCVNVKGSSGRRAGRAYGYIPSQSNAPPTARYLISLRFGVDLTFPWGPYNYNCATPEEEPNSRFPFIEIRDWREMVIALAAHEAHHVHQFRHGKSISEVGCERFAARALARWRERSAA